MLVILSKIVVVILFYWLVSDTYEPFTSARRGKGDGIAAKDCPSVAQQQ